MYQSLYKNLLCSCKSRIQKYFLPKNPFHRKNIPNLKLYPSVTHRSWFEYSFLDRSWKKKNFRYRVESKFCLGQCEYTIKGPLFLIMKRYIMRNKFKAVVV